MDDVDFASPREVGEFYKQRRLEHRIERTEISERHFATLTSLVGEIDCSAPGIWRMAFRGRALLYYPSSHKFQYQGRVTAGGVRKMIEWMEQYGGEIGTRDKPDDEAAERPRRSSRFQAGRRDRVLRRRSR